MHLPCVWVTLICLHRDEVTDFLSKLDLVSNSFRHLTGTSHSPVQFRVESQILHLHIIPTLPSSNAGTDLLYK